MTGLLIARVDGDYAALLREVFIATLTDAAARMGKTPPSRDDIDVRIQRHPEDGALALLVAAFGYETIVEWDGTLAAAVKEVVDTAVTRAFDFDK
jgi:hypothetical protein